MPRLVSFEREIKEARRIYPGRNKSRQTLLLKAGVPVNVVAERVGDNPETILKCAEARSPGRDFDHFRLFDAAENSSGVKINDEGVYILNLELA